MIRECKSPVVWRCTYLLRVTFLNVIFCFVYSSIESSGIVEFIVKLADCRPPELPTVTEFHIIARSPSLLPQLSWVAKKYKYRELPTNATDRWGSFVRYHILIITRIILYVSRNIIIERISVIMRSVCFFGTNFQKRLWEEWRIWKRGRNYTGAEGTRARYIFACKSVLGTRIIPDPKRKKNSYKLCE